MRALLLGTSCAAILFLASSVAAGQAQYNVIYSFGTNPGDGSIPNGGLLFDQSGNIYGTTQTGGSGTKCQFCGTVFELSPSQGGGWTETVIHNFCSQTDCADGEEPAAGLIPDKLGNLYGTTVQGGVNQAGTVFELSPPIEGGSWTETILWNFDTGIDDGVLPYSRLNWDAAGNLYGTTSAGGVSGGGAVFELSPNGDGSWAETVLYMFCPNDQRLRNCPDGVGPLAGVSFDKSGNLYSTTFAGGNSDRWGVLYELSPMPGGNWTETTLYKFVGKGGGKPLSAVNFDEAGNAYVTASSGAPDSPGGCGGVFKFIPNVGGGGKKLSYLFFPAGTGCNPDAGVLLDDQTHTVYGTTHFGGNRGGGNVYGITGNKGTVLYSFCSESNCVDGVYPSGSLTANANKLYSTTTQGGGFNQGVVFEIEP
jgi:uncharacterized repeat protein (TIGR03803 family)